ncbi:MULTISPECIES: diguanylate cyclase [unclassified Oceanispirochaeta]|uniref:diguanylate cyclase n=1 Tax=unclassified Oceanispirochaeta TaxID=2635722 RepID=UPI000E0948EC|nr:MULTISPECIES: diguanylate cyclase [unclassified Oceanispirochaeta]MBF9017337.1 diguanylate cyclase [Oceanispirochaeta sp. M2]NPD73712.1 diguanylate cyclase [Oceanispirochaeta sp. M1]RDG30467.1 diguanylate cyclase [Oceanispirochaeta sp. M1]
MRFEKIQYKEKLVSLLLLLLSLIFIITYTFLLSYFKETEENINTAYIEKLSNDFDITIDGYTGMADLVLQNSIITKRVLNIVNNAVSAKDEEEKDQYRKELYKELTPIYSNLTRYNFRQLHFQEADNRSLLRFHKPDKYGDDLTGIRYSVEYVNANIKNISGFEEGRIFNGYRFVYPLIYLGKHIGSVELSISMSAVISQLESSFNQESQFILLKSVVDKKVFESEQSNYRPWHVNSNFVLDSDFTDKCILADFLNNSDKELLNTALAASRLNNEPFTIKVNHNEGNDILTFLPISNFENETVAYIFSISDDTNIQAHQRSFYIITIAFLFLMFFSLFFIFYFSITNGRIQNMVQFDLLTKAYTRRLIFQKLDDEFLRYQRYMSPFSICMIDIDHFKKINDTFGHQAGDLVLAELAELIMSNIRMSDYFGRYGGEEFLLVLPETEFEAASLAMENLREIIEKHHFKKVKTVEVSAGIAAVDETIHKPAILIENADINLYKAKENGRNQIYPAYEKSNVIKE